MSNFGNKLKDCLWNFRQNKKAQIIVVVVIFLSVLGLGLGILLAQQQGNTNNNAAVIQNSNINAKVAEVVAGYPIAVMIENLQSVRPQSGLGDADIVYEALAEGGITRFMAVYLTDKHLAEIGPVRSARNYYVVWAEEYQALYAHVGGSPQALATLADDENLVDLNQFYNAPYFWRKTDIAAPHNLMTSSEKLAFALRDKIGENATANYTAWLTKKEAAKKDWPTEEKSITLNFSSDSYKVEWKYAPETNTYLRLNGGVEHLDKNTGKQISAKNIVVQYVKANLLDDAGRLDLDTVGEGQMVLFQDGISIEGTWKKTTPTERTRFYDEDNQEIKFNLGNIWVEVLPEDQLATY